MARADFAFHYQFRVRWSETDAQGVVFNARYLDYADVAVTEYWRAVNWRDLLAEDSPQFHIKKATIVWSAPIKPDEMIEVMARTGRTGRTSMTQIIEIHGVNEAGHDDLRAEIEMVSVHIDLETHRPKPLPEWIAQTFATFDSKILI